MPNRPVVPITDIGRRPPEAGRIRLGVKKESRNGKMIQASIDTLRFTSPRQDVIEQLAVQYGGTARPWHDDKASPKDQFEVITTTSEIDVYLYPDGLNQSYEKWGGGGCERRCDGVEVTTVAPGGPDGPELTTLPCICAAKNLLECKLHTRLSVVIPSISFAGVWRVESKGRNASEELPGMFDMIASLQASGAMTTARLGVRREQRMIAGKRNDYVVPYLAIPQSVRALQAGGANAQAIAASPAMGALGAGTPDNVVPIRDFAIAPGYDGHGPDDEARDDGVIDAEELDDEILEIEGWLSDDAQTHGLDTTRYVNALRAAVGAVHSASPEQRDRLREAHRKVVAGELTPLGFTAEGKVQWKPQPT